MSQRDEILKKLAVKDCTQEELGVKDNRLLREMVNKGEIRRYTKLGSREYVYTIKKEIPEGASLVDVKTTGKVYVELKKIIGSNPGITLQGIKGHTIVNNKGEVISPDSYKGYIDIMIPKEIKEEDGRYYRI